MVDPRILIVMIALALSVWASERVTHGLHVVKHKIHRVFHPADARREDEMRAQCKEWWPDPQDPRQETCLASLDQEE